MRESMQEDMRRVRAQVGEPRNFAVLCELLRLYRVCAFARCRKSQCCRGGGYCFDRVDLPESVLQHAVWLMMTARLPWIVSGRANERLAYECWIARIDAGTRAPAAGRRRGAPLSRSLAGQGQGEGKARARR